MMNQDDWNKLRETFNDETKFDHDGYYCEDDGFDFEIMDWLECSSVSPSWNMKQEFARHGYYVYPGESDSFGWLIGIVKDRTTGRMITFG